MLPTRHTLGYSWTGTRKASACHAGRHDRRRTTYRRWTTYRRVRGTSSCTGRGTVSGIVGVADQMTNRRGRPKKIGRGLRSKSRDRERLNRCPRWGPSQVDKRPGGVERRGFRQARRAWVGPRQGIGEYSTAPRLSIGLPSDENTDEKRSGMRMTCASCWSLLIKLGKRCNQSRATSKSRQ
jgi:hypothetical protein